MAWVYLIVAGGLETLWATTMQLSEGFTKLGYSLLTLGVMAASVLLLAQAMKSLPMGTAYAVWTGIGALGAVRKKGKENGTPARWPATSGARKFPCM